MAYYEDDCIDLSDNNYVKVVRYRIVYTRRGYEAVLPLDKAAAVLERVVTITRNTSAEHVRGEIKTNYLRSLPRSVPHEWQRDTGGLAVKIPPGAEIDATATPPLLERLSQEDQDERVVVSLELLSRIPRPEKEYERDQANALEGIEEVLKERL